MFNKKVYLTESDLKEVVKETARRLLEEGFLKDKLQSRREEKDRKAREAAYLKATLERTGAENPEPCHANGKDGFKFEMAYSQAHSIASTLKNDGVRLAAKRQDGGGDWDRTMEFFAWLEPYVKVK